MERGTIWPLPAEVSRWATNLARRCSVTTAREKQDQPRGCRCPEHENEPVVLKKHILPCVIQSLREAAPSDPDEERHKAWDLPPHSLRSLPDVPCVTGSSCNSKAQPPKGRSSQSGQVTSVLRASVAYSVQGSIYLTRPLQGFDRIRFDNPHACHPVGAP